jgi:hypothetical protein
MKDTTPAGTAQYVVVLTVDPAEFDDDPFSDGYDDSIENACRWANVALQAGDQGTVPTTIRPLSEVIAA